MLKILAILISVKDHYLVRETKQQQFEEIKKSNKKEALKEEEKKREGDLSHAACDNQTSEFQQLAFPRHSNS